MFTYKPISEIVMKNNNKEYIYTRYLIQMLKLILYETPNNLFEITGFYIGEDLTCGFSCCQHSEPIYCYINLKM